MTNFASLAVEIPEYNTYGVVDGVLTTNPPMPVDLAGGIPNVGTLAWVNGNHGSEIWFTGCSRRLAMYVGGGESSIGEYVPYQMQTPAAIESRGSAPPVSLGTVVLPGGWALLAIM